MNLTDQQIVSRAGSGDATAFTHLVDRYRLPLISYVYGLTGRRDDAEELAQEAFCRVWEKLPTLRQADRVISWLYRIAHNLAISAARRPRIAALRTDPPGADPAPDSHNEEVHRAVARLPEALRVVVALRHFVRMSHDEIARALGIPPGTARSRLSRAYDRLRADLGNLLED